MASVTKPAPIYSLPPEILSHVFEVAQKQWPHIHQSGPLLAIISLVSRHWHDVAADTQVLHPPVKIAASWSVEAIEAGMKKWEDRHIPRLELDLPYGIIAKAIIDQGLGDTYCDLVVPYIQRCSRLSIVARKGQWHSADSFAVRELLLHRLHVLAVPQLQQFELRLNTVVDAPDLPDYPPFFSGGAPMLIDLRLGGPLLLSCIAADRVGQVTDLHLAEDDGPLPFKQFITQIRSFSSLTSLSLYDDSITHWPQKAPTAITPPQISFPTLRHLYIYGLMTSISPLFLFVSFPMLESLHISPFTSVDLAGLRGHSGKAPSFPSLRSLAMSIYDESQVEVVALATTCFPNIAHLVIRNVYKGSLASLADPSALPLPWPGLESVALSAVETPEQGAEIVELVRGRLRLSHNRPIKVLYLSPLLLSTMDEDHLRWLRANVEIKEIDVWEVERRNAMYSDESEIFVHFD